MLRRISYGCAQEPFCWNRVNTQHASKPKQFSVDQTGAVVPAHILVLLSYIFLQIFTLLFLYLLQAHIPWAHIPSQRCTFETYFKCSFQHFLQLLNSFHSYGGNKIYWFYSHHYILSARSHLCLFRI